MYKKWNISLSFSHTQHPPPTTHTHTDPLSWSTIHICEWSLLTIVMSEDSLQCVIEFLSRKSENCTREPTLPFISKHYHNQENSLKLFWKAMEDTFLWFTRHGFQPYSSLTFLLKKLIFQPFLELEGAVQQSSGPWNTSIRLLVLPLPFQSPSVCHASLMPRDPAVVL